MTDVRVSKKNDEDEVELPNTPNPRLTQAYWKRYKTLDDHRPVDTHNPTIINHCLLPDLPDNTHKKRTVKVDKKTGKPTKKRDGARSVSYHLRSAFAALSEAHLQSPLSQLSSIVVNFDHTQSDLIVSGNASKAGATFYSNKLQTRFKAGLPKQDLFLFKQPRFFLTLEDSVDGSLHANIVMQHHPDDVETIRKMLKAEAKNNKNSVSLKTEYELWLDAEPNSELWQLNELERDDYPDLCSYPDKKENKQGLERFYRMTPIDAGISKELEKPLRNLSGGARLAMDSETRRRAKEIFEERHKADNQSKKALQFNAEHSKKAISTQPETPVEMTKASQHQPEPLIDKNELAQFKGSDDEREAFRAILETQGLL